MNLKPMELLAPAGSPEKMKYALAYGADAVYAGIPAFSLRARINAFDLESLKEGVAYAHQKQKRFYVTLNIYAHNRHLKPLEKHLEKLGNIPLDGIIVSDPGVLSLVKKHLPKTEIHLSTQANATNWAAVRFWKEQGVQRVILAREVTLPDIREIHRRVPDMELEYFVHGAMCMSYSGRCILSKWMTGRSANLGDCAQPCRWSYHIKKPLQTIRTMTVEDRQQEWEIDLEEDRHGTYFFNSYDLNLLQYLPDLQQAGISSLKIEGRNKSVHYLATVVRAYRRHLDALKNPQQAQKVLQTELKNLDSLTHRGYTAGFLLENEPEHNFDNSHNPAQYEFVGEVLGKENGLIKIKAHNAIYKNDQLEIISPQKNYAVKLLSIYNQDKQKVTSAHGGHSGYYYLELDQSAEKYSLLRKRLQEPSP